MKLKIKKKRRKKNNIYASMRVDINFTSVCDLLSYLYCLKTLEMNECKMDDWDNFRLPNDLQNLYLVSTNFNANLSYLHSLYVSIIFSLFFFFCSIFVFFLKTDTGYRGPQCSQKVKVVKNWVLGKKVEKKKAKYFCGKKMFWNFPPKNIFGRSRIIPPRPREKQGIIFSTRGGGKLFDKFGHHTLLMSAYRPLITRVILLLPLNQKTKFFYNMSWKLL